MQVPDMTDYHMEHGATYRYIKSQPLYPFGFGLSYTKFKYSDLRMKKFAVNSFRVSFQVENTGEVDADEVS